MAPNTMLEYIDGHTKEAMTSTPMTISTMAKLLMCLTGISTSYVLNQARLASLPLPQTLAPSHIICQALRQYRRKYLVGICNKIARP
jgi:hypothetical protein